MRDGEPFASRRRPDGMPRWRITLLTLALAGCVPATTDAPAPDGTLQIEVVAGPVCPVEREPPDPACSPRPVVGARLVVQPGDGRDILVAEAITDEDGHATLELAPGDYIVVGGEVEGLMGSPQPATGTVSAGRIVTVTLAYDTGIR